MDYKIFCEQTYRKIFKEAYESFGEHTSNSDTARRNAQKVAADQTFIQALLKYRDTVEDDEIWKAIGRVHKVFFAKLDEFSIPEADQTAVVERCVSAHQSWNKMSGHSFERYIANIANEKLRENEIRFILKKELTTLLKKKQLANTAEDIQLLEKWNDNFDLYAIQTIHGKTRVFGCIQSKTSIRDRVGRDLPFSCSAMENLFWSVAVTLVGDFLQMPKFVDMVNGGGSYDQNGWHGMYAISGITTDNCRIYKDNEGLEKLIEHAIQASECFISDRRNLDHTWQPE